MKVSISQKFDSLIVRRSDVGWYVERVVSGWGIALKRKWLIMQKSKRFKRMKWVATRCSHWFQKTEAVLYPRTNMQMLHSATIVVDTNKFCCLKFSIDLGFNGNFWISHWNVSRTIVVDRWSIWATVARSLCAEMHSGFLPLRHQLSMNSRSAPSKLWNYARSAAAVYAPVVLRFCTYEVKVDPVCQAYADTILALPAMQEWLASAIAESEVISAFETQKNWSN